MLTAELLPTKPGRPWALRELPVFPAVALELIEMLDQSEVSITDVTELLRREPALATEVLRFGNSARFVSGGQITDLQRAVTLLGLRQTRQLALTKALRSLLGGGVNRVEGRRCWEHCVSTAAICEALSAHYGEARGRAYTAGLLHDIGQLVLLAVYPHEYAELLSVSRDGGYDLLRCERSLFDIDHCQAGAWLVSHWKLPPELNEPVSKHHEAAADSRSLVGMVIASKKIAEKLTENPEADPSQRIGAFVATLPVKNSNAALSSVVSIVPRLLELS